jgi:uncharacterized damage-inducible protein DinB
MTIVDRLLEHNTFATGVLIERCRSLSVEQFTRQFAIGPGSLHDTLRHVVGAMYRWSDRIADRPFQSKLETPDRTWTCDELLTALAAASTDLNDAVARVVKEDRLDELMELTVPGYSEVFRFTRGTAIVHIATHGVHHRAQALNMLRQLGETDLPDVDAIEWELETTDAAGE